MVERSNEAKEAAFLLPSQNGRAADFSAASRTIRGKKPPSDGRVVGLGQIARVLVPNQAKLLAHAVVQFLQF